MTDDGVLAVKDGLEFDKCPECGHMKFTLTRCVEMEKEVNISTDSATPWQQNCMPGCVESIKVKCNSCGETWDASY